MITKAKLLKKALSAEDQQSAWLRYQEYNWDSAAPAIFKPANLVILFDHYTYEDYCGSGHIIGYDKTAKQFFEVYGSHCSCYGLEGQWDIEYSTREEIAKHTKAQLAALDQGGCMSSYEGEYLVRLIAVKDLLEL